MAQWLWTQKQDKATGNQYGSAHCLLLPREDVEGGSSEAEQCDSR